jgi:hypothetical protein
VNRLLTSRALLPIIGLAVAATPLSAQTGEPVIDPPAGSDATTTAAEPRTADTPADRFGFFEGGQLQVSTGTEDDALTLRVALPTGPSMSSRFAFSASTPLHGGDDALPASLDALANGTRATVSWGYFDLPIRRPDQTTEDIVREAKRKCIEEDPQPNRCNVSSYAVYHYKRDRRRDYLRGMGAGGTDVGVEASVGINDFEWTDPITFLPQKERHTDWGVAIHGTMFLGGLETAITGSAAYQRAFDAAEEQQLCPAGSTNPADCVTTRLAAPGRNENLLLSVGLRHRFLTPDATTARLAVAPIVTYDVIDDVWGVDVPVYFIPGANNTLTGGVRFGYRSDREKKFSVGVFLGTTFDFLGGGS